MRANSSAAAPRTLRGPHFGRRCRLGRVSVLPRQSQGTAPRALAPFVRLRPMVQPRARHRHPRDRARVRHDGCGSPMSAYRLPAPAGERLDRCIEHRISIQRRGLHGLRGRYARIGAARQRRAARRAEASSCTGRAESISCGVEEPTGLVDVGSGGRRTPNVRATLLRAPSPVSRRAASTAGRAWASTCGALNGFFSALLPAGFYYKTFKWPSWHLFEPSIRRMAGFGPRDTRARSRPLR